MSDIVQNILIEISDVIRKKKNDFTKIPFL